MGIAGMILGIIGLIFGFIPVIGAFIAFPCIAVGLPLAIIGFFKNRKAGQGTGMAIAGMATNAVALVIVIVWLAAFGAAVSELSDASDSVLPFPASAPASNNPVVSDKGIIDQFGCQWIMDTYRPMEIAGRDAAITHVANAMNIEREYSLTGYVATGDAAQAVRTCEERGYK